MVRELEKKTQIDFPKTAPAANPVFFRTYSRKDDGVRETWEQVCDRTIKGLEELGKLTPDESKLLHRMMLPLKSMPSGRWLWVGGTDWIKQKENFSGAYNCTSTNVIDWEAFGLMMDLAMQGCGTGAVLEPKYINQLPPIKNHLHIILDGEIGTTPASERREETEVKILNEQVYIYVGDSRQGWVKSYQTLLEIAADTRFSGHVNVIINLSDVRAAGEPLKGFGGVANPVKLVDLYHRCSRILNNALGRQLTSVECCLLIDEAAVTIVAGNIRRCLPEDALVHTSKGLVPIRDVKIGDLVQTPLGFRRVVDKFDQGMQEVYEIETNATYPRATLNHKQAVLADAKGGIRWKTVSELTEGDRLQHNTQILTGTVTKLPEDFTATRPSQSHNAKSLIIPDLTPKIAWLIGFTQGDGYVALGRNKHDKPFGCIEWSMNAAEPEMTAKLRAKIDSALVLFGLTATHGLIKGENTAKSICSSMRLAEYFHRYIKQPNTPLVVPNFILQGSIDVRAAYLAGLMDSDGSIKTRPPHLVTSVYPAFIRQVGAVLSSLGIAARTKINHPQTEGWQIKYSLALPALKGRYNDLIAPYSVKGALSQGLKMYGFTIPPSPPLIRGVGGMMLETYSYSAMRSMGFQGSRSVDANYERYLAESDLSLDIPVTVKGLGSYDYVQTFDIEVEEAHCFYCDGYLTHNSAGMRQGSSKDQAFSTAKDNLWQQDQDGNWRIDPTRDALRMANHTRVFHQQPTLEETINAVRKQYYSGEGAIQYAPESILRANTDLFPDEYTRKDFCQAYLNNQGKEWLQNRYPEMSEREINHRLGRYGLNPCVTADTWVHTEKGPRQIKDLIGQQIGVYVNGELFSTTKDGFWETGVKPVFKVVTEEGFELRLTDNHQLLKITAQTQNHQYSDWCEVKDLQVGDRLSIHNHRKIEPWSGVGNFEQGYEISKQLSVNNLVLCNNTKDNFTGEIDNKISLNEFSIKHQVRNITHDIEQRSYEFYGGFLQGIFELNSKVLSDSISLFNSDFDTLKSVQRMLARLGIISKITPNELIISGDNLCVFQELIGFKDSKKAQLLEQLLIGYKRNFNRERFTVKIKKILADGVESVYDCTVPAVSRFDANGLVAHNCGEIIGADFHCNLSEIHLNQIDPLNYQDQEDAFKAAALSVATLLNHRFEVERYRYSREIDPIVGVSFTGLFDFFVHAFGVNWLQWWEEGRPNTATGIDFKHKEAEYLRRWRDIVHDTVWEYCDRHQLNRPNRCTTIQPSGTKSLLTGASPGWHPPKSQRFIRRITFRKNDPVALACFDYGYSIIPSQSDKDEKGNLLNDPFDPRCSEWLVEIPTEVSWANLASADQIDIGKFSALAQFDFYMNVQQNYTTHNTSATIELRENEIEPLGNAIYEAIKNNQGYISAALLARFDDLQTFPRLPFEPIDKETYLRLSREVVERRKIDNFVTALRQYDQGYLTEAGPAGCDSDKCLLPEQK